MVCLFGTKTDVSRPLEFIDRLESGLVPKYQLLEANLSGLINQHFLKQLVVQESELNPKIGVWICFPEKFTK